MLPVFLGVTMFRKSAHTYIKDMRTHTHVCRSSRVQSSDASKQHGQAALATLFGFCQWLPSDACVCAIQQSHAAFTCALPFTCLGA